MQRNLFICFIQQKWSILKHNRTIDNTSNNYRYSTFIQHQIIHFTALSGAGISCYCRDIHILLSCHLYSSCGNKHVVVVRFWTDQFWWTQRWKPTLTTITINRIWLFSCVLFVTLTFMMIHYSLVQLWKLNDFH